MKKLILVAIPLVAGLLWYMLGGWGLPESDAPAADAESSGTAASTAANGVDRATSTRPDGAQGSTAADVDAMNRAEDLAAQGLFREALQLLPPELAARNPLIDDQRTNIYTRWKAQQRDDRVAELTRLFESAPEDATFQRYKISQELIKLAPKQKVYAELAAEYAELWRIEQSQTVND
jgi:hypothetical protein